MNLEKFITESHKNNEYFIRPRIYCNDGFYMSVQGSKGHYCSPRENVKYYTSLEVGYPSEKVDEFMKYAENKHQPTDTVYGWVPSETIQEVIDQHGGIDVNKTF